MPTRSDFKDRVDVLDMLISILKEHEENLSNLADRFDAVCNELSLMEDKISVLDGSLERLSGLRVKSVFGATGLKGPLVTIECKDWLTFRGASQGALLVAFEVIDDQFIACSISDLFIFTYFETAPQIEALMVNSFRRSFEYQDEYPDERVNSRKVSSEGKQGEHEKSLQSEMVKRWLTLELGIPKERIVEGRILR